MINTRRVLTIPLLAFVLLVIVPLASAYWTDSGGGSGTASTATMPAGPTPTVSASGTTVTVSFTQVQVVGMNLGLYGLGGYQIKRYPAVAGAGVSPAAGTCAALVTGAAGTLSCTETGTPRGDWKHTVTPILGSWTGAESAKSATVVIAPDPASNLDVERAPAAKMEFEWDPGAGATGYNVYRRTTSGSYNFAAPLNGGTPVAGTTYTDTTSVSGTSYNYVVRSVVIGSGGQQIESANSNETAALTADGSVPTSVVLAAVPALMRGNVTLTASANDTISGLDTIIFEYRTNPSGAWTEICTEAAPYQCDFDTTAAADGLHDFRVIAVDGAGNQTTSAVQSSKRIDNTAPTVTLGAVAQYVRTTITVSGSAVDPAPASGLSQLKLEIRQVGAPTWTTLCTSATTPISCSMNPAARADGNWEIQLTATDAAGNVSAPPDDTQFVIDKTAPTVTMTNPGSPVSGVILLESTSADATSGVASVLYQYKPSASTTWADVCTGMSTPFACSADTTGVPDGNYDLRAIATDNAGNQTTSAVVTPIYVDNSAPSSVTMTNPGSPLRGTITLNASAVDSGGGIADVRIERSPAGTGTWTTVCTDTTAPYSCSFDTSTVTDALYDFRAVATDNANNSATSAVVANRRIDNTPPSVTLTDPGSPLRGTIALSATASDAGSGMASVVFQYKLSSSGTWTTISTDASSPYTASWNASALNNTYDIQAIATDLAGNQSVSLVTNIVIDNTAPTAVDIQIANGGFTVGRPDAGDTITYTFSEPINPASILAGWDGSSTNVTVRLNNSGTNDQLFVYNQANSAVTALGRVDTGGNYVTRSRRCDNSTMVMSGNTVIVTLGTASGGVRTDNNNRTAVWRPVATALDLAGNPMSTATRNETGAADRNF